MLTQTDTRIRLAGTAALILLSWYFRPLFGRALSWETVNLALESVVIVVLTWESCRGVLRWSRRRYPSTAQSGTRLRWALPLCWAAAALVSGLDMVAVNLTGILPAYPLRAILGAVPASLIITMTTVAAQEAAYYFTQTVRAERAAEALQREWLRTQLESLKQQVNPHFLFNSLNTLSCLLGEDPARADAFLLELCKVYRYLLQTNAYGLTTLAAEVQFIHSYYHLLKTRYGDALHLELAIEPAHLLRQVPSLTLQLLMENAVKHNILHRDTPLLVRISTTPDGQLVVSNNLQLKPQPPPSAAVGLHNIRRKFELLGQPSVRVTQTADEFRVTLPLLARALSEAPSTPAGYAAGGI